MIRLTGHLDVARDQIGEVMAALADHIRLTRAEPGCLKFEVTTDRADKCRLLVHELFASRADFQTHQLRARQGHWGKVTAGIQRHYCIEETSE